VRPTYENDRHRTAENSLVRIVLEPTWRCRAVKLPVSYGLDHLLMRGRKAVAFLEIKGKPQHTFNEMISMVGGVPLDLDKLERALHFQTLTKLPFALVCAFSDGIYRTVIADIARGAPYDLRFGGRTDRGDWQDREPYIVLEPLTFKYLCPNRWSAKALEGNVVPIRGGDT
jgi:hypothetical protein